MNKRWIAIFVLLSLFSLSPALAEEEYNNPKTIENDSMFIDPSTIDPFAEGAGSFLDADLMEYAKKAYESYEEGDYLKSAQYYLALLHYNVNETVAVYNLACCYGLLGKDTLAARYLARAYKSGFTDIQHILQDPDFDGVRESAVFSAILDSIVSHAEEKQKVMGDVTYNNASVYIKCRVLLPSDYDSTRSYPLVVGLHGWGSSSDGFIRLWELFGEPEFIYASPQAPYAFPVGGELGFSWEEWIPEDKELAAEARLQSEAYVMNAVTGLEARHKIDKVYLMGFSQGGNFTYSVGIKNHEAFDGIISLGGWLDTEWVGEEALEEGKDLAVFIGHAKDDKRVAFKSAKEARKILEKLGYNVTFYAFEGGHSVPAEEAEAMIKWIEER
ncbi:hypothetical protein JXM67_09215 [candidate division WOR-3 bacterium]|nr:hypothetical protein [candidate division WOR-3 bacterium]